MAAAVGVSQAQAIAWLDPTAGNPLGDFTHAIWDPSIADANLAIIEVRNGAPFGTTDADGDFSVRILDFCTTPDCVSAAQAVLRRRGQWRSAVAVPFSAATDGRDHWLARANRTARTAMRHRTWSRGRQRRRGQCLGRHQFSRRSTTRARRA